MSGPIRDIVLALALLAVATGAGAGLLKLGRVRTVGALERWVISLSLGFAIVSYLLFSMGSLGWLNLGMVLFVFAGAALLGFTSWSGLVSSLVAARGRYRLGLGFGRIPRLSPSALLVGLLIFTSLVTLVGALAPPTEWDSLQYHLSAVKYFIDQGEVSFVPYKNWALPMTAQMWNMLGLLLDSDRLPQLFQWSMGLGSAAALYLLAAGRTSHRTALLAATIYYTAPRIFNSSASARSDFVWLTFVFLSLHALLAWRERQDGKWLVLSAIFTGLALGTKLQTLFWVPGIGLALVVLQWSSWRRAPLSAMARLSSYGAVAGLVASPWWLRNWLASGDPIWPYGYPIFRSRFWTQELWDKYAAWSPGPGGSIWHYVTGPWNLTVNQSAWEFGLRLPITPVLLACLPGLFLIWTDTPGRTRRLFYLILVSVLVYYTLWFRTYQQPYYFIPVLALLGIPAAYSFWGMMEFRWTRWASTAVLTSTFLLFMGYIVLFNMQFAPVVFGFQSRHDFLVSKVSFYDDIQWVNHNLPLDSRLMSYHTRIFYLQRDFMRSDSNLWENEGVVTARDLLDLLSERGITHVFLPGTDVIHGDLLKELEGNGSLVAIYSNPNGVKWESRTLSRSRRMPVRIFEVVYDSVRGAEDARGS